MPHIWIEYSGNLDLDTRTLMRTVQDAAVGDGTLFPLAGARTRALRVDDCLIVDGHPDNAFVHVVLRIGHGRSDTQKTALDELGEEVEHRKQGVAAVQEQQRNGQNELAELRKQANGLRGRLASLETLQQAALGQEQGAAVAWLKAHGLDSAARVGERLDVDAGWENAVESALGQLIEGVLVDDPDGLVDALGCPDLAGGTRAWPGRDPSPAGAPARCT
ncbi:hypothetical protein G6F40_013822 [Rhizopus arrhizus]|nr:hypothetical protein G6F40_013822 [Rhizopus arrhizus]